ncbi:hypothetical protein, partial [Carnobacterium maltaromaticum]|uniref:hypothetical protein n=1 Tax=Carnobacterium maltaromaticum TaxID=2751 RepID=UPI0005254D35
HHRRQNLTVPSPHQHYDGLIEKLRTDKDSQQRQQRQNNSLKAFVFSITYHLFQICLFFD